MSVSNMLPPDQSSVQSSSSPARPAVPVDSGNDDEEASFHDARSSFERAFLVRYLEKHAWNISRTAAEIGMERSQLHRKIKAFGLVQQDDQS